jgi:hypothetical protein
MCTLRSHHAQFSIFIVTFTIIPKKSSHDNKNFRWKNVKLFRVSLCVLQHKISIPLVIRSFKRFCEKIMPVPLVQRPRLMVFLHRI